MKTKDRRELLYNLLTSQPEHWFTQEELCLQIKSYILMPRKNNDRCPSILVDIKKINADFNFKKILICKDYMYKVATEEEAKEYLELRKRRLINQARCIQSIRRKARYQGLGDIFNEEDFYNAYADPEA